jgi:Tol biopolymer transport system component
VAARAGPVKLIASTREESSIAVSTQDGRIVLESAREEAFELWIAGIDGSGLLPLTHFNGPERGYPQWSPDGTRVAFNSHPEGPPAIFTFGVDGAFPCGLSMATCLHGQRMGGRSTFYGSSPNPESC